MSKGKPNSIPTSVEAQIRTRARNLPVYKCYVNKNWKEAQLASVLITRKHTNGNVTMGNYLVDLKLRGIKDCTYKFNESPVQTEDLIKRYPDLYDECDYNLAHNIIHAGLEFAGDYGFDPHKDFKTAQFILEEDTDDIPLMEIPLGDDGIPVLELHPGESGQREIALLEKTAGDNFHIIYYDENGNPQSKERTYNEVMNEILKTGIDAFFDKRNGKMDSFTDWQVFNDVLYLLEFYTDEDKLQIDEEIENIVKDTRLFMTDEEPENDFMKELNLSVKYFEEGETEKARAESRRVIDRYSDNPMLWNILLYNLSVKSDEVDEKTVKEAYLRFPEHPVIKAWYAEWLAQKGRGDEVFTLFDHLRGLDALTTENIPIHIGAIPSFCFAYAMAWLMKEDLLHAEPYYQLIVRMGLNYRLGDYIQDTMVELKSKKIAEKSDGGEGKEDQLSEIGQ